MLTLQKIMNRDIGKRRFFVHPAEPPAEYLLNSPTDSIYLGKTKLLRVPVYWTYKILTNPHIAIVGISGSGKSYLCKTFLTRASIIWKTNSLILDWAGEYSEWVRQAGGKVINLGKGDCINLLDLGGMRPIDRIKQILSALEILTDLQNFPTQKKYIEQAIEFAYTEHSFILEEKQQKTLLMPTFKDVERILKNMLKKKKSLEKKEELEEAIYRIGKFTIKGNDFFSGKSTINLSSLITSGLISVDLHSLPNETFRSLAGLSILQFVKEKMRDEGWSPKKGVKLWILLDEAWKIAQDDRSDAITIVREGRKYHFGLIVASQNPTDVNKSILSNVGTIFIMRLQLREFKDYVRSSLNFSDFVQSQIDKFGVGNAALHMVFQAKTNFSQTFLLDKIDGEEPLSELKILGVDGMQTLEFEKEELRKSLIEIGLSNEQVQEILNSLESNDCKLNILQFVSSLEKFGLARSVIITYLRTLGVKEKNLVKIFSLLQRARLGVESDKISTLVLLDA